MTALIVKPGPDIIPAKLWEDSRIQEWISTGDVEIDRREDNGRVRKHICGGAQRCYKLYVSQLAFSDVEDRVIKLGFEIHG